MKINIRDRVDSLKNAIKEEFGENCKIKLDLNVRGVPEDKLDEIKEEINGNRIFHPHSGKYATYKISGDLENGEHLSFEGDKTYKVNYEIVEQD